MTAAEPVGDWRPTPFHEFVLKVSGRCNLACDYCYVYTKADQSWRTRPVFMSPRVWRATAARIGDHVRRHGQRRVKLVLHGGEPLLAGAGRLAQIATAVRAALPSPCDLRTVVQTNGVLIDPATLETLAEAGIHVGVSLDGPTADHDRHRRFADGRGSHTAVRTALELLGSPAHSGTFAGILCTVDLDTDPLACYTELRRYRPPAVDFLLPHANWSEPPAGAPGAYARWLIRVFDEWYGAETKEMRVILFEEIIHLALGGRSRTEQVGLSPVAVAVVESDGTIEQVDSLKSVASGAPETGLNVFANSFDEALRHPGIVARQIGVRALCDECLSCPVHHICGAGHYAHRYRRGSGFRHPSVYCGDLRPLIGHVVRRLARDTARLRRGTT